MSFQTAITGLNAARKTLSVTSENIANSNTPGFKSGRAQFADLVTQSSSASLANDAAGVRVASVEQSFAQGSITSTGNPLDMSIGGNGFFTMRDPGTGESVYTRAGQFQADENGYVVNSSGQRLSSFTLGADGTSTGAITDLRIDNAELAPQATTTISTGVNLDAGATPPTPAFDPADRDSYNHSAVISVYDSLGVAHTATQYFRNTGAGTWDYHMALDGTEVGTATALVFDTAGNLTTPADGLVSKGPVTPAGADAMTLSIDLGNSTQFDNNFSVHAMDQNGHTSGELTGVSIDADGVLNARYSNGETIAQGQVVLASFTNPNGLQRMGENNWIPTGDSGPALLGAANTGTLGGISAGTIEESNVELSEELVDLISAQRMFQANAQSISAADTLTQTLLNMG
ncbi:MAG: flagellar hook protein FlgE [Gammaproteobacteria bacterium]|nr:flagellar hook protein FlgE [Gammaproteobacteria bacterium]